MRQERTTASSLYIGARVAQARLTPHGSAPGGKCAGMAPPATLLAGPGPKVPGRQSRGVVWGSDPPTVMTSTPGLATAQGINVVVSWSVDAYCSRDPHSTLLT